ncbi:barrier-to-autointegration factor-like isoform X2 [Haliotis asinina]|uniref:barrier-to-autointegration factor-like isoform X2 n=1 Tax=Haliotis asinina TaxID=109174 RepID=UPI003531C046
MSSTSQKHRNFVSEPMGEKLVTELAGIGPVLGGRLNEAGFDKAYNVLGQFLLWDKNKELFVAWLHWICSATANDAENCYKALNAWCDSHL